LLVVCLALAASNAPAIGQTPADLAPDTAYPRGASAYFAGRTAQAETYLTAAIEYAPDDPRGYYLRGLNYLAMGDTPKAQADLSEGARLEARMGSSSPYVDRSLASVQGPARVTLERIRRAARESAKVRERQSIALALKDARMQREQRVLRTDYQLPMEVLASRLSVDQARRVAIKDRTAEANLLVGAAATADEDESVATGEARPAGASNPFADDSREQVETFTTSTSQDGGTEVPEAARGTVKASSLLGIFGRVGRNAASGVTATASDLAGEAMDGGGPGPMGPGGMDGGGFDRGEFEEGEFDAGPFGESPPDDNSPFREEGENPFEFDE
jgi:hypothetical protein